MNISRLVKITLWLVVYSLMGCRGSLQAQEQPAVLEDNKAETHVELEQVVSKALGQVPISLAMGALTQTDRLIVERKKHRTIEGGVLDGRSRELPDHFRLVIKDTNCLLIHEESGKRYPLSKGKCRLLGVE